MLWEDPYSAPSLTTKCSTAARSPQISQISPLVLTKQGVGEAVPHAALFSYEPASLRAGREAERGAQYAHQQVADGNVNQEQVDGRP